MSGKKSDDRTKTPNLKDLKEIVEKVRGRKSGKSGKGSRELVLPDQLLPPSLFILPIHNSIVFPTMMAPINVSKPELIQTIEEVMKRQRLIGLLLSRPQKNGRETEMDTFLPKSLYKHGVAAKILKRIKMPDGSVNLLVHAVRRFKVRSYLSSRPHLVVNAAYLEDETETSMEVDALSRSVISEVKKLSEVNPFFTDEMKLAMLNAPGPGAISDLVAFALALPKEESQQFVETTNVKKRYEMLLQHLCRERDVANIQKKIQEDVNDKIGGMQRDYFLKEQLKAIKKELGMEEDGKTQATKQFREQIEAKGLPEEAKKIALSEVEKFETLSDHSPEYNVARTYLETICALPWSEVTIDQLELDRAQKILDEDHYGLERVKERIIEYLAVRNLMAEKGKAEKENQRGSIICLVGPPGVGKTSVGKSIARTLGRKFYRFSLGGMRDEAEIKGHRRTYIGAMPGKIIQALKRVGTKNPVLMLDEIDKLGQSFHGDPASALLECLDSEQNSAYLDHYVDIPFDLSQVLFVATANSTASIPPPLLDRMEVIELPGYTMEEKEKIATKYVIPRVLEANGLKRSQVKVERDALKTIMQDYAREPGLRTLQQNMERIARRSAAEIIKQSQKTKSVKKRKRRPEPIRIQKKDLKKWLGPPRFYNELAERISVPGVVVGLAWTATGGDILFIEASELPGTGQLKLTGQMGDVMTESGNIAWSYVKKRIAKEQKLKAEDFKHRDLHLHIPSGAIPKDGPSAGITMATALYSLMTKKLSKQRVAMTGELSLTGKVLPVGGVKEKILAAKRVGITTVLLPKLNQKDLPEIPAYALKGMKLVWVDRVDQVFKHVLGS